MKKITSIFLVFLIIVQVFLIIWKNKKDKESSLQVKTTQATVIDIENKRLIPGNLYPMKEIEIKSPISGTLEKIFVKVGDKVNIGDKIAQIKIVPNPADIEVAKKNLVTARLNYESDKKTFERFKQLFENNVIPASDYEYYQKTYEVSKEIYNSAQNQLTLLQEGFVKNQDISNIVKSTTKGNIIDLPLKEGTSITERNNYNNGTTLAVVARLDSFVFRGKINETDLVYLRKGMELTLIINAYKIQKRKAMLEEISAKGIEEQEVMKYFIRAKFGMLHDTLTIRSGYTANAELVLQKKKKVLGIEEKNVLFQNDSAYLEVLNNKNLFEKRFITTGLSDGINVEVIKGINKDDRIKIIE